jgi:hypothetical protein
MTVGAIGIQDPGHGQDVAVTASCDGLQTLGFTEPCTSWPPARTCT